MTRASRWWWDLTTEQFAALDMSRLVAIQPVAAVEQHGPHLPVRVDAAINQGILERALTRLPEDRQALALPMMAVGKSNEHFAFPGTLGLSSETLSSAWFEIGESIARAGGRRVVFFNSHGGQPQLMDIVCRELRVKLNMFAVACSWFNTVDVSDLVDDREIRHGIHAGQIETSMMLHLHPELVDMTKAQNFASLAETVAGENKILRSEGSVGFGWQTQDLNPFGACGDARGATAELGRELVERAADLLATLIAEVGDYPLSRLTQATAYNSERAFK